MPLVSVVDPDLSQEETVIRILQAKEQFNSIANNIFLNLNKRIADISKNLETNVDRFEKIKDKIATLNKFDTAVVLKAPSKFADAEYTPAKRILPFMPGVVAHSFTEHEIIFSPKNTLGGTVDVKKEMEHRKQFFATSQLMPSYAEFPKEQRMPSDPFSVADLFFIDSEQAAYDKIGGSFISYSSKSKSITSRQDQNILKDNLDRTALGDRRKFDDSDIFTFRPLSADVPDLELPDFLPDLPGVAVDVIMTDLPSGANKPFLDFEQKIALPDIEAPAENNRIPGPLPITPAEEKSTSIPKAPPLPQPSNIPVVSPPPPPPPPPPSLMTPSPSLIPPPPPPSLKTPMASPAENDGRSDLMAAIRAAGGVGKVKLKSAGSTLNTRQAEEKQSLRESSALSSSTGGGDLMSSLTRALEARRKALTGTNAPDKQAKPASITGVMSRISDMIPPPEKSGTHSDSGDEDWT